MKSNAPKLPSTSDANATAVGVDATGTLATTGTVSAGNGLAAARRLRTIAPCGSGAKWDYHNCTGTVEMHRTYRYKSFTVDVDTQPVECVADGTALSAPVGYIAVVSITRGNMPMMGEPLRVGRSDGRLFATEAEALMRGYGDAQTFIDHW
jgi:hypothetical protein